MTRYTGISYEEICLAGPTENHKHAVEYFTSSLAGLRFL